MSTAIKHRVLDLVKSLFWHPGTVILSLERHSAWVSKFTQFTHNFGLIRCGTYGMIYSCTHMAAVGIKGNRIYYTAKKNVKYIVEVLLAEDISCLWLLGRTTLMHQYQLIAWEYPSVRSYNWSCTDTGRCMTASATHSTRPVSSVCGRQMDDDCSASFSPAWGRYTVSWICFIFVLVTIFKRLRPIWFHHCEDLILLINGAISVAAFMQVV